MCSSTSRYSVKEKWVDKKGKEFTPGTHYYVGGNTKLYGAALLRMREKDFGEVKHHGGISPAWPITYKDFEPYYLEAEKLYHVHGSEASIPPNLPRKIPFPIQPWHMSRASKGSMTLWKKKGITPFLCR